jgi:hypothetical protein
MPDLPAISCCIAGDVIAEAGLRTAEGAPESSMTSRHPTMGRFQQGVANEL